MGYLLNFIALSSPLFGVLSFFGAGPEPYKLGLSLSLGSSVCNLLFNQRTEV